MEEFLKLLKDTWTSSVKDTSLAGVLDKVDAAKLVRNTLQVAGSAALASGVGYFGSELLKIDWGTASIIVLPLVHLVMDYVTKKYKNNA